MAKMLRIGRRFINLDQVAHVEFWPRGIDGETQRPHGARAHIFFAGVPAPHYQLALTVYDEESEDLALWLEMNSTDVRLGPDSEEQRGRNEMSHQWGGGMTEEHDAEQRAAEIDVRTRTLAQQAATLQGRIAALQEDIARQRRCMDALAERIARTGRGERTEDEVE